MLTMCFTPRFLCNCYEKCSALVRNAEPTIACPPLRPLFHRRFKSKQPSVISQGCALSRIRVPALGGRQAWLGSTSSSLSASTCAMNQHSVHGTQQAGPTVRPPQPPAVPDELPCTVSELATVHPRSFLQTRDAYRGLLCSIHAGCAVRARASLPERAGTLPVHTTMRACSC